MPFYNLIFYSIWSMKNVINEHKIPFEIREPQAAYNAKNMAFLKESAEELNSGKVVVKTMEELESMENE